jgi:hypothetical protein
MKFTILLILVLAITVSSAPTPAMPIQCSIKGCEFGAAPFFREERCRALGCYGSVERI